MTKMIQRPSQPSQSNAVSKLLRVSLTVVSVELLDVLVVGVKVQLLRERTVHLVLHTVERGLCAFNIHTVYNSNIHHIYM